MAKKKTKRTAKRRALHKKPPKKKNRSLSFLWLVVLLGILSAVGYVVATGAYKNYLQPKETKRPKHTATQHKETKKHNKKINIQVHDAPKQIDVISIEELLKYGEMADEGVDDETEISWYEPNDNKPTIAEQNNTKPPKPTKNDKEESAAPPPAHESSHKTVLNNGKRPKLVIIIDDVSRKKQLDTILALPYHITPSIFPPSELSSTSNKLTKYTKHYMIHLPMESGSAAMNKMKGMLFVRDSAKKVQKRVDELRRLFPRGKFINNHTGSVFTANCKAMKRLYAMLRQKGFVFVDSRTSAKSKVRKIARDFGDRYIARDVFIDNVQKQSYILKQLKKAVKIAKKRGFAIAIGHPHKATINALKHAGKILSGVQTVYIDELYR